MNLLLKDSEKCSKPLDYRHLFYVTNSNPLKPETYGEVIKCQEPFNYRFTDFGATFACSSFVYGIGNDGEIIYANNVYPRKICKLKPIWIDGLLLFEESVIEASFDGGIIKNIVVDKYNNITVQSESGLRVYSNYYLVVFLDDSRFYEDVHTTFNRDKVMCFNPFAGFCVKYRITGTANWESVCINTTEPEQHPVYTSPEGFIYIRIKRSTLLRLIDISPKIFTKRIVKLTHPDCGFKFDYLKFIKHLPGTDNFVCVYNDTDARDPLLPNYFVGVYYPNGSCMFHHVFRSLGIYHVLAVNKNLILLIGNNTVYSLLSV